MVPAPWWRWTTLVSALLPILSLVGGDFPAFFFMLVWPIIGFCTAMRVFAELEERSEDARSDARPGRRARTGGPRRARRARPLAHRAVGQGRARRPAHRRRPGARQGRAGVDPGRPPARRWPRCAPRSAACAPATSRPSSPPRRSGARRRRRRDRVVGTVADTDPRHRALLAWVLRESVTNVVRHARAPSVVIELGAAPASSSPTTAPAAPGAEGNGLRGMRERVAAAGGTLRRRRRRPGTRVEVGLP